MSEGVDEGGTPTPGAADGARTAGALLREARQAQGMHIAALAAAIKVSPRKLEALEGDRYDELPDTTFTRALAQTVCRALKIDAEPVLAKLPQAPAKGLEQVSAGINAPFRERGVRRDGPDRSLLNRPVVWGSLALVLAAAAVYWLPSRVWTPHFGGDEAVTSPTAASPASSQVQSVPAAAVPTPPAASAAMPSTASSMAVSAAPAAASAATTASAASAAVVSMHATAIASAPVSAPAATGNRLLVQTTTGPSWVDVRDAGGAVLISRLMSAGESVTLEGQPPLRVKIGHAAVTQLTFRGQPVPLSPGDTVVRLELK